MGTNGLNHKDRTEKLMDSVGWRILEELQADARINFVELGRRVGLTSPAVADRVRRMEEAGIITGYQVIVNPARVGLPIVAIIRIRTQDCRWAMSQLNSHPEQFPEVLECYHITGEDTLVMRVAVAHMPHLEDLVLRLHVYGDTTTSVVFSAYRSQGITQSMLPGDDNPE